MIVWEVFLILVSLAVTAMSLNCTLQFLDEPPGQITVLPGSSLTLYCSSTCQGGTGTSRVLVTWHFNGSISTVSERAFTCINDSTEENTSCNCTKRNVTYKDRGLYHCKLTIDRPMLWQKRSRGTRVDVAGNEVDALVTANPVTETPGFKDVIQSMTFLIGSGVSALLLILLVIVVCVVQRRRQRRKEMTCPIYGNTRPVPSATRRQQTSKPDTPLVTGAPPQAQTPRKGKSRGVAEKEKDAAL